MSDHSTPRASARSFEEKYSDARAAMARRCGPEVLGSYLVNGYTTTTQADRLAGLLDLSGTSVLLDVGAGRGWPGTRIAGLAGCRLVSTDVPIRALQMSREGDGLTRLGDGAHLVCADGRLLPFGDRTFDAVCHADVLC